MRYKAVAAMGRGCPLVELWVRASAHECKFAESVVRYRMLDRFHARNHLRRECKATFNPDTKYSVRIRNRFQRLNAVAREQTFAQFNGHSGPRQMGRLRYPAFWKHNSIQLNNHIESTKASPRHKATRPAVSRRLRRRTSGVK